MKLIAHRGNIDGPNPETENTPEQIVKCIDQGYDVEVDIRIDIKTNTLWLEDDTPDHI